MSSRLLGNTQKDTISSPQISAPTIWVECQLESNKAIIYWNSLNEMCSSDFFIVSMGRSEDERTALKVW